MFHPVIHLEHSHIFHVPSRAHLSFAFTARHDHLHFMIARFVVESFNNITEVFIDARSLVHTFCNFDVKRLFLLANVEQTFERLMY